MGDGNMNMIPGHRPKAVLMDYDIIRGEEGWGGDYDLWVDADGTNEGKYILCPDHTDTVIWVKGTQERWPYDEIIRCSGVEEKPMRPHYVRVFWFSYGG